MRYMLLIYGPEMAPSEGAAMPDMEPWNAYTQWMIDTGIYRSGDPLAPSTDATTVRVQDGRRLTTDGPFAEDQGGPGRVLTSSTAPTSTPRSRRPPVAPARRTARSRSARSSTWICRTSVPAGSQG